MYGQQRKMFEEKTHVCANRIVSIYQPHVRPIIRGKAKAKTESKIVDSISRDAADKASKISDVADILLDRITELASDVSGTKALKELTSALKDLKEIKGYKSELDIKEQEARIRTLEQRSEQFGMNGDDKQTGVLILPAIIDMPEPAEDDDGQ